MMDDHAGLPLLYDDELSAYASVPPYMTQLGHYLMRTEKAMIEGTTLQELTTSGHLQTPHLMNRTLHPSTQQPYKHFTAHYSERSKAYSATQYHLPYQWTTMYTEDWLKVDDTLQWLPVD